MGRAWGQLGRRARVFTAVSVLATLGVAASASSASALPRDFWGVVPQGTPSPEQLLLLKRGGVDSVRIPISWSAVQPRRNGGFDFSGTDSVIASAVEARLDVLPFLFEAPRWAVPSAAVPRSRGTVRAPRFLPVRNRLQRSGWRRFVIHAIRRYGPRGVFWAEHPELPKRPIRTWQIWNEPNFKYFVTRPNPVEYGKLVKLSYGAAKSADRGARIVLGGLFSNPAEARFRRRPRQAYTAREFLQIMYRRTRGIKAKFQGVALHPYASGYSRLTRYIEEARRVLKANHDAGKGLWITELGWSSEPPRTERDGFAKGLKGQARQLRGAFRLLRARRRRWHVQGVYWFSVDDQPGSCNFCDGSGLFGDGFRPKPAWRAYVRFAGGRP
jgi:polysaccharide biosynthesis protein PslG